MRRLISSVTLPGCAVFIISLIILIRSLSDKNIYEILLSVTALVFFTILFFTGKWTRRRLAELEPLLKPPFPLGAASGEDWIVMCGHKRLPLFFRLHVCVRGRFFPQGRGKENESHGGSAVFLESPFAGGSDTASFTLRFPLGGLFTGETYLKLRDIFGFFSFKCGIKAVQSLKIRNAVCRAEPFVIRALSGAEDRRIKTSSDEERYYMREYTPGDRLRDINWKSSERIDTLITRVSPDNQEKITRIEVFFRSYGPPNPGIGDLWLLDRAKARLIWFLRSVKEEMASYIFLVHTANETRELKDTDEIEDFGGELAVMPFSQDQSAEPQGETPSGGRGEIYIFSTACDSELPAFLLARQGQPITLFLVQTPLDENAYSISSVELIGKKNHKPEESMENQGDFLRLREFPAAGFIPPPSYFLPQKVRHLHASGCRIMIDYAGTKI